MEKTIDQAIDQVVAGKLDFQGFLKMLSSVGIERYKVDVATHEVNYYGPDKSVKRQFPFPHMSVASVFNEGAIKNAIVLSQKSEIDYPAFLQRIADAGVANYETDIDGRKVTYFGDGRSYIEPFPLTKQN